jgi:hypothetical protein
MPVFHALNRLDDHLAGSISSFLSPEQIAQAHMMPHAAVMPHISLAYRMASW